MKRALCAVVLSFAFTLPLSATEQVEAPDHPPNCPSGAGVDCKGARAERSGASEAGLSSRRCKQDAKICPDGRMVLRTGPRCTFATCSTGVVEPTCMIIEGKTVNGKFATSRKELPKTRAEELYGQLLKKDPQSGELIGMRCAPQ